MPVSLEGKDAASKASSMFSVHLAAFGFWVSTRVANIVLNVSSKKTHQSLPNFQTGIGPVAHATSKMGQLISSMRSTIDDTVTTLQGSEGDIIPVSILMTCLARFKIRQYRSGLRMSLTFQPFFLILLCKLY